MSKLKLVTPLMADETLRVSTAVATAPVASVVFCWFQVRVM
jgi:hypothetical protein